MGVKGGTGEMIVGDEKGVWRTRTVKETRGRPVEPREPEVYRRSALEERRWRRRWPEVRGDHHGQRVPRKAAERDARGGAEESLYHQGRPGGARIHVAVPGLRVHPQGHDEAGPQRRVRKRFEKELENTEKARRAKKRISEYTDKKVTQEEERKKKKKAEGEQNERDADEEKPMDVEKGEHEEMEAENTENAQNEKVKRKRGDR